MIVAKNPMVWIYKGNVTNSTKNYGYGHLYLREENKSLKIAKGVIRIRKSKKYRQYNGQKKKDTKTSYDLQNIHIKLKIE
jgi:hypothetical protein